MPQTRRYLPLASIIIKDRVPIGPRTLNLVKFLEANPDIKLPPIHVAPSKDGKWLVLDGRHRVIARRLLGYTMILARYGVFHLVKVVVSGGLRRRNLVYYRSPQQFALDISSSSESISLSLIEIPGTPRNGGQVGK